MPDVRRRCRGCGGTVRFSRRTGRNVRTRGRPHAGPVWQTLAPFRRVPGGGRAAQPAQALAASQPSSSLFDVFPCPARTRGRRCLAPGRGGWLLFSGAQVNDCCFYRKAAAVGVDAQKGAPSTARSNGSRFALWLGSLLRLFLPHYSPTRPSRDQAESLRRREAKSQRWRHVVVSGIDLWREPA